MPIQSIRSSRLLALLCGLSVRLSVCLPVCLLVTRVSCAKTAEPCNRAAVCVVGTGGPKKPRVRWGPDPPTAPWGHA